MQLKVNERPINGEDEERFADLQHGHYHIIFDATLTRIDVNVITDNEKLTKILMFCYANSINT